MKSILILQNEIMEYRKPLYNGLADYYEITVLHSGNPSVKRGDRYKEIIIPQQELLGVKYHSRSPLADTIDQYESVIAMFDLRWPGYIWPLIWKNRPRFILWGHGYGRSSTAAVFRDRLMKKADAILLYDDESARRIIKRGVDESKIYVAWNTVKVENHKNYSEESKRSFLFVGRIQKRKRIDLLIESFSRIKDRIKDDFLIDIVGFGQKEKDNLTNFAHSLGVLNKVIFHGEVHDQEALANLYKRCVAYVSPGHVGLGVLHSFAYGVPVVTDAFARHGPEFSNLSNGENALLFESKAGLDHCLETLCNDKKLAEALGTNAYEHYVNHRRIDHMIAGFQDAIENRQAVFLQK